MLICIELKSLECGCVDTNNCGCICKIYGSWNDWKHSFDIKNRSIVIGDYLILVLDTDETAISYEIMKNNEYMMLDNLTTTYDGLVSNLIITTDDGFWFNGQIKIKNIGNEIIMYKNNKLIVHCLIENNKLNGKGIYCYENGKKMYEGYFKDSKYDGEGIYYYENGRKMYEGCFKGSKYNGKGTYYYKNGEKMYEGCFKDSKYNGKGTYYYKNGEKMFEGCFKNSRHDVGTYYHKMNLFI